MPPSNSKDKGKARASDADVSDNENASPPRSRPVVHPYASVPRASTSSIRQPNGQSSSSRRSSSPSPLYPPPLATRHASSASSSKSRPRAARVATDSEDEQYEPNGSARRPNARLFEGWTRRNASESRQPVSPLESFREPVSILRLLTYIVLSCHSRHRAARPRSSLLQWTLSMVPFRLRQASRAADHQHRPSTQDLTSRPNLPRQRSLSRH